MGKQIVRTPVPAEKKNKERKTVLRWRLMRNAEAERRHQSRIYTRYKNNFFIATIKEATNIEFWSKYDIARLKNLRRTLETEYNIPINFYSVFIYYSTYRYMHWKHRDLTFQNFVGFISHEGNVINVANFIRSKSLSWRKKRAKWPDDFEERWGIKTSLKTQKLGSKDKIIEHDLMSNKMLGKIKRFL